MVRHDMDTISDDEFDKTIAESNKAIVKYIKDEFLNEYIAYNLAICYKMDSMWSEKFDLLISSAIEDFYQITVVDCDKNKIKKLLEEKYKLKVIKEEPTEIEEL